MGRRIYLHIGFGKTGSTKVLIAYVRPQVEYLNSAWWQWFAWRKFDSVPDLLDKQGVRFMRWADRLERLQAVDGSSGWRCATRDCSRCSTKRRVTCCGSSTKVSCE